MPLKSYGVLAGRPIGMAPGSGANPHIQIHLVDDQTDWRVAVNVASALAPSELLYLIDSNFKHPVLAQLEALTSGWHALPNQPGGPALDFIRSNLFDPRRMVVLPASVPGPDNDLNEKIGLYVQRAMADEGARVYAFGERWGPEVGVKDKIFGFSPGNGVHDIHMNQGNVGSFVADDGVYQDGALLLHFPARQQWVGVFLKFQSPAWHTDDRTGHTIGAPAPVPPPVPPVPPVPPSPPTVDGTVRIVAALVSPAAQRGRDGDPRQRHAQAGRPEGLEAAGPGQACDAPGRHAGGRRDLAHHVEAAARAAPPGRPDHAAERRRPAGARRVLHGRSGPSGRLEPDLLTAWERGGALPATPAMASV